MCFKCGIPTLEATMNVLEWTWMIWELDGIRTNWNMTTDPGVSFEAVLWWFWSPYTLTSSSHGSILFPNCHIWCRGNFQSSTHCKLAAILMFEIWEDERVAWQRARDALGYCLRYAFDLCLSFLIHLQFCLVRHLNLNHPCEASPHNHENGKWKHMPIINHIWDWFPNEVYKT